MMYRKFKPLFFWPEQYRRIGTFSNFFMFDEDPRFAPAASGGATVGGALWFLSGRWRRLRPSSGGAFGLPIKKSTVKPSKIEL
jgi:hypothetical protein